MSWVILLSFFYKQKGERKMQSNNVTYFYRKNTPWFRSRKVIGLIVGACMVNWLLTGSYVAGQMEIQPTKLVLKQEGCAFIQAKGLAVSQQVSTGTCSTTLPFRANVSDAGGTIYIYDQPIVISDSQIIAVEEPRDMEWSPHQRSLLSWLCLSFSMLLLAAAWMIRDIRKDQE